MHLPPAPKEGKLQGIFQAVTKKAPFSIISMMANNPSTQQGEAGDQEFKASLGYFKGIGHQPESYMRPQQHKYGSTGNATPGEG